MLATTYISIVYKYVLLTCHDAYKRHWNYWNFVYFGVFQKLSSLTSKNIKNSQMDLEIRSWPKWLSTHIIFFFLDSRGFNIIMKISSITTKGILS